VADARWTCVESYLTLQRPSRELGLGAGADTKQHTDAGHGEEVDESDVSPVDGVPVPEAPVDAVADQAYRVQMAYISEQQDGNERVPYTALGSGAQD
jgi:hypothetical protein